MNWKSFLLPRADPVTFDDYIFFFYPPDHWPTAPSEPTRSPYILLIIILLLVLAIALLSDLSDSTTRHTTTTKHSFTNQPSQKYHFSFYCRGHLRPILALSLNLATLFPRLYITFFAPATSKSQGVIDNEINIFSPNKDVSRRFRVIPLGGEAEPTESAASISSTPSQVGDIQIEEISRRRAAWSGHVERFLAALPGALKALNNGDPHSSSLSTSTRSSAGEDTESANKSTRKPTGVDNKETNGGFATPPTLFILDVRVPSLLGVTFYQDLLLLAPSLFSPFFLSIICLTDRLANLSNWKMEF
jgi:hypothetical protein